MLSLGECVCCVGVCAMSFCSVKLHLQVHQHHQPEMEEIQNFENLSSSYHKIEIYARFQNYDKCHRRKVLEKKLNYTIRTTKMPRFVRQNYAPLETIDNGFVERQNPSLMTPARTLEFIC